MKKVMIPSFTVALMLLTASVPNIPAYALTNPSVYFEAENTMYTTLAAHTVNSAKDIYVPEGVFDKTAVVVLAENEVTASSDAITTGSAVTAAPSTVDIETGTAGNYDPNEETNASIRMKPLKDKLATITTADIADQAVKFKDIGKHWSKEQVAKLSILEIVNGLNDGTFRPDNTVTAAEFIKMAVAALGYKPGVNVKYWAQNYIDYAIKDRLINKGDFADYNKPISREWVASIALNAAMLYDNAPGHEMDNVVIYRMKDYKDVKDTLKQKTIDANLLGLMSVNNSGKFLPKSNLTRAEAATVILRLLDNKTRTPFVPKENEMIKITSFRGGSIDYLTSTNKAEVLPMTYKIIEATQKTKGFAEIDASPDKTIVGITLWENKEKAEGSFLGDDIDMQIALKPYSTSEDDNARVHPYVFTFRNPQNVKALHMDFVKEVLKTFYTMDYEKVLAEFNKLLDSAVKGDSKNYDIDTYKTGIKFGGRGISLIRSSYDPEFVLWIYSK